MIDFTLSQTKLKQKFLIGCDFYLEALKQFVQRSEYKSIFLIYDTNLKEEAKKISCILKDRPFASYGINVHQDKDTNLVISAIQKMQKAGCLRNTLVIAFGGGFIGDISGVVSAVYMRGVDYIQVGTTSMSQFDAIVQKVAVNVNHFKNIMGAFHSPILTICDAKFVEKDHSYLVSLCEVFKHKIIAKTSLEELQFFETNEIRNKKFTKIIYDSLKVKLKCVKQDPFDTSGIQKKLSLGHTIANIIETKTSLTHGEAVWIGLLASLHVSLALQPKSKYLANLQTYLENFISRHKIKLPHIKLKQSDILELLRRDKISTSQKLTLVLVKNNHNVVVETGLDINLIISALEKTKYVKTY